MNDDYWDYVDYSYGMAKQKELDKGSDEASPS